MDHSKIAIIGTGTVGSTIAYALILKNLPVNIALIDIDEARCRGEVLDLSDAEGFCKSGSIFHGSIKDVNAADIIIIAAGKKQEIGQTREELLKANHATIKSICSKIKPKKTALLIMVTNPVDLMTYFAQKYTNLKKEQIFGSGTFIDTQRLRLLVAKKLDIAEQSIHAYILGEHGDSQFPAWSCAYIGGIPLLDFKQLSKTILKNIENQTRDKAYEIIACKGATFYGIGTCVAILCRTILYDQKRVTPVSCWIPEYKVCMSMPVVLGKDGVGNILPIPLTQKEKSLLNNSAKKLKQLID